MFEAILKFLSGIIFFVLHGTGAGAFPKALDPKQEARLLELYKKGDQTARSKLIEHNLRLVAHVVKKYYSAGIDNDDLISIGTIGLIKAVSSYDADKGIRLATYASRCIENEILMYFRSQKKTAQNISISEPIDTDRDGNALTLIDVIADDRNLEEDIDLLLHSQKLSGFIREKLDRREQEIICLRYGLGGGEEMPQREVAKKLGISRSYVSRIEKKALEKLRAAYEE